jgi:hypothetical protein
MVYFSDSTSTVASFPPAKSIDCVSAFSRRASRLSRFHCTKGRIAVRSRSCFNIYDYRERLEAAGFTKGQVQVQTLAIAELVYEWLATKEDLRYLESRFEGKLESYAAKDGLKDLGYSLQKKLDDLKAEMIEHRLAIERLEKERIESSIAHVELPSTGIHLQDIMDTLEKNLLLKALEKTKNKKEAAKLLNITLRALRHRLRKHDINPQRD